MISKSFAHTKIRQKTEKLSKIVGVALFRTIYTQYKIVSSQQTFASDIGHPFRGGKFRLNQFGEKDRS